MRIVAAFVFFALAAAASFALGLPMADETPAADAATQPAAEAVADKKEIPDRGTAAAGLQGQEARQVHAFLQDGHAARHPLQVRDLLRRAKHACLHARAAGEQERRRPNPQHLLESLRLRPAGILLT